MSAANLGYSAFSTAGAGTPESVAGNVPERASASPPGRTLFYADGYWWAFWEDDAQDFVYASSLNGETWSSPGTVATNLPYDCACASVSESDGTVLYAQSTESRSFNFTSGSVASDGVIDWTAESSVATAYDTFGSVSVTSDALGDPWVAVYMEDGSYEYSPQYVEVFEQVDGTWDVALGPVAGPNYGPEYLDAWVQLVNLPDLSSTVPDIGVLYSFIDCTECYSGVDIQYQKLSGGSPVWSSAVEIGASEAEFSATAIGSTVYLAGSSGFGGVDFSAYTLGGSVASPVKVAPGKGWSEAPYDLGTDVSIAQGAADAQTLVLFYENPSWTNLNYSVSTDLGSAWSASQAIYSTDQTIVNAVDAAANATDDNDFGVLFTNYAGTFALEFDTVSVTSANGPGESVSITLTPGYGGETAIGASNYFWVNYTLQGAPQQSEQVGGTLTVRADANSEVYVSGDSSGGNATERWCLYLCNGATVNVGATGTSVSLDYYQQLEEYEAFETSDGTLPSDWCGSGVCEQFLDYSSAGLPLSSPLGTSLAPVFIDVGSTWSVVDPAFDSTSSTQWYAVPGTSTITTGPASASAGVISGTITGYGRIVPNFYLQYSVQAQYTALPGPSILLAGGGAASIELDGLQAGEPVELPLFPEALPDWLDADSSFSVSPATVSISPGVQYQLTLGGAGSISGTGLSVDPYYLLEYGVTFAFAGTVPNGLTIEAGGDPVSPGTTYWYAYGISLPIDIGYSSGFLHWTSSSSSLTISDPSAASTSVSLGGTGTITAVLVQLVPVLFIETGLAAGTSWTVQLGDQVGTSSTSEITFQEPPGRKYVYGIGCIEELCADPPDGTVSVGVPGASPLATVDVSFLSPWSEFGYDPGQSDQSPYVGVQAPTLAWTFLAGDEMLEFGGGVCPIDIGDDGYAECLATSAVSDPVVGPDGTVYFAAWGGSGPTLGTTNLYDGNLFALTPSGTLKWAFDTGGAVAGEAPVVGPNGVVYFLAGYTLFALSPAGTVDWQIQLVSNLTGSVPLVLAPGGGTLYVVDAGYVYAIDTEDGAVEWVDDLGTTILLGYGIQSIAIKGAPAVGPSGDLYVDVSAVNTTCPDGDCGPLHLVLDAIAPSGDLLWSQPLYHASYEAGGATLNATGTIFTMCNATALCAISPSGSTVWKSEFPVDPSLCAGLAQSFGFSDCTSAFPAVLQTTRGPDGTILATVHQVTSGSSSTGSGYTLGDDVIVAFNQTTGTVEWQFTLNGAFGSDFGGFAVGADGTIYFGCGDNFFAMSPEGKVLWVANEADAVGSLGPTDVVGTSDFDSAPAIGADGMVYIGDTYGHLFAFGPGPYGALPSTHAISFVLHSPINLLVALPNGTEAGFNATGALVNTAGGTVLPPGPGQLETIELTAPPSGQYGLHIFGTGSGSYRVAVQTTAANGSALWSLNYTGVAAPGSVRNAELGVVTGGALSDLSGLNVTQPIVAAACSSASIPIGGSASCSATVIGATGSLVGDAIGFASGAVYGVAGLPSPAICTISSGDSCAIPVSGLAAGTTSIEATFLGDAQNSPATGATPLTVYATTGIEFQETGLPAGTDWSVAIAGQAPVTGTASTLATTLPLGAYSYTVSSDNSKWAAPGGTFTATGETLVVPITFSKQTYTLTFVESGLPAKKLARIGWTVVLNGTPEHSDGGPIVFTGVANGTYPVLITGPSGYELTGSGTVTVNGATTVDVAAAKGRTVSLVFTERKLPKGTNWCVTVDGDQLCTSKKSLKFVPLSPGTYAYAIGTVAGESATAKLGKTAEPLSGTLTVSRSSTVVVTFSASGGSGKAPAAAALAGPLLGVAVPASVGSRRRRALPSDGDRASSL